jgi:hypothetical protein
MAISQLLVNRAFHAVVEGRDAAAFLADGRHEGWLGDIGAGGGEVEADHRGVGVGFFAQRIRVVLDGGDDAAHRAPVAQVAGECTGIEALYAHHAVLGE